MENSATDRESFTYERNIEAHMCNHYCRDKTSRTYSEYVSATLISQHALRTRHMVICDNSGSAMCFHIRPISQTGRFSEKYQTKNMCFDCLHDSF